MQWKTFWGVAGAAVVVLATAKPIVAHHSFAAEFDVNKPVKLRGSVTKVEWINPHMWIHLDVQRPDGTVETWLIEGGAPNALFRRGWKKTSLLPGTEILVEGYQAKNGSLKANGRDVTLRDGTKLFVGTAYATGGPDKKQDN